MFSIIEYLKCLSQLSVPVEFIRYQECQHLFVLGLIKMPLAALRKTIYEELKNVFDVLDGKVALDYLELLLLKILDSVVSLPNDKKLKEYFLFTSFFLSQVDPK